MEYLDGLNIEQREAVDTLNGPLLVLAGAGTGKTRVLTTRLAHLLKTNTAFPGEILAVTFTNKAAQEMKMRVASIMGVPSVEGWWLGTFHSLAARMLRRHADLVELDSNFTIIDTDDQIRLIKQLMENYNVDTKKWPPKMVAGVISRWKDKGHMPDDVNAEEGARIIDGAGLRIYRDYQTRLKAVNACDFGDLLLHMIHILKDPQNAPILADYHRRFRYILVDEYQDTNVAQYLWLRLLAQGSNNICCVGDDDQSIYGWRGAEVDNILRFEKDFENAKIIRLEQNYRSTKNILGAASAIIANNSDRLGKTLWSDGEDGPRVTVKGVYDGDAEARWVGEEIESLQHRKISARDIAILVRAGFQTREFEDRFIQLGIPYKVIGGQRFFERMEIRDALAYLRVTAQPKDDLALERIINVPKRGIGGATIQKLYLCAREQNISLYESIREMLKRDLLKGKTAATLENLIQQFENWRGLIDTMDHADLAAQILDESGYIAMWKADKSVEAPGRLENLGELTNSMAEYESLPEFLEHVSLVLENQGASNGEELSIMTLHGAKGLEFPYVFLPGWEEGLFPSQRSMDENGLKGLEEERRLAYVGLTRARYKAFISFTANRRMYGSWTNSIPSRFVDELAEDNIETDRDMGWGEMGRSQHWDSSGFQAPKPQQSQSGVRVGVRVTHDHFGTGTVIAVNGAKLDVVFDGHGRKKIMESFVALAE